SFICVGMNDCAPNTKNKNPLPWKTTIKTRDIGKAETFFQFNFSENTNQFTAYTRKNADKDILGWTKSKLARIFTKNFKGGSLLHIEKGQIIPQTEGDSLKGILTSSFGNYYFDALKIGDQIEGKLLNGNKEIVGLFEANIE